MRFTIGWLKEHLEFRCSINDLCEKLTSIGLEVEECKDLTKDLRDFIVSEIIDLNPHPNADKLNICDVNDGDNILKIVCGASNAKKGMRTVLAKSGCIIYPGSNEEFVIENTKIRGVNSNGMLCSKQELGLSNESDGIIELNNNYIVGDSFSKYISDENIEVEISITPNRVDCAGVFGVARDLSASGFGILKQKTIKKNIEQFESSKKISNKLKNTSCPYFLIREIKNVDNTKKSTNKIINRFNGSGLKVISPLVDITNFILIDRCRPLHVFDSDKVEGNIEIRYSKQGEIFEGLDEKTYTLDDGMIVICDKKKIISLAGILGGKNSSCDETTKNVLIESAYFCPKKIAMTGRKLNILSDARYRFERGIDPNSTIDGIELATEMIIKTCGGKTGSIIGDSSGPTKINNIKIDLNFFEEILGCSVDKKKVEKILINIGCSIKIKNDEFEVIPPSWRQDIKIKEDLVEEVGRLIGFDKIIAKEFKLKNKDTLSVTSLLQKKKSQVRKLLVSRNIMETISWSFSNKKWENLLNPNNDTIEIENPISAELSCMRSNLLGGLLNLITNNNNKDINNISIFEIGPVFYGTKPGDQNDYLTVVRSGKAIEKNWTGKSRNFDIYDIKSDLFSVLRLFNIDENKIKIKLDVKNYFHPGKSGLILLNDKEIASFGELHPRIAKSFKIKNYTCFFELYFKNVIAFCEQNSVSKNQLTKSSFQSSIRDFSFDVDKKLSSLDFVKDIKNIDKNIISQVRVFDNYENEDTRSLAIEVLIQSREKTLTENEINQLSDKIINHAKNKFNAKLR